MHLKAIIKWIVGAPLAFCKFILEWAEHADFVSTHWRGIVSSISWISNYVPYIGLLLIGWGVLDWRKEKKISPLTFKEKAERLYPPAPWWKKLLPNSQKNEIKIQLLDATRLCLESVEGDFLGNWVHRVNNTPEKKLAYFYASFVCNKVSLYGERPPSTLAHMIPPDKAKNCVMVDGTNDIRELAQNDVTYKNVYLLDSDLKLHIQYLHSIKSLEEC